MTHYPFIRSHLRDPIQRLQVRDHWMSFTSRSLLRSRPRPPQHPSFDAFTATFPTPFNPTTSATFTPRPPGHLSDLLQSLQFFAPATATTAARGAGTAPGSRPAPRGLRACALNQQPPDSDSPAVLRRKPPTRDHRLALSPRHSHTAATCHNAHPRTLHGTNLVGELQRANIVIADLIISIFNRSVDLQPA
jgi:hypothetical protein